MDANMFVSVLITVVIGLWLIQKQRASSKKSSIPYREPSSREEIDSCKYLFLRALLQSDESAIQILLEEGKAESLPSDIEIRGQIISGTHAVLSDKTCKSFQVVWPSYVAYSVRMESYCTLDKSEEWEGKTIRLYKKSHFLDYISKSTFASDSFPGGPLQHWEIVCGWHVIDIITTMAPQIHRINLREHFNITSKPPPPSPASSDPSRRSPCHRHRWSG